MDVNFINHFKEPAFGFVDFCYGLFCSFAFIFALIYKISFLLILYIENPKDSTRKLLELINEYSKVAGYEINTQKSLDSQTLTMRKQKEKLRKQFQSPLQ